MSKKVRFMTLVIVITLIASMLCLPAHAQAKLPKNGLYETTETVVKRCSKCGRAIGFDTTITSKYYINDRLVQTRTFKPTEGLFTCIYCQTAYLQSRIPEDK